MTGDTAAEQALSEALVLLNGSPFQRSQGAAALKEILRRFEGSRAAEQAVHLLSQQNGRYQPPSLRSAELQRLWNTVGSLNHPGLRRIIAQIFSDDDSELELFRQDVATGVAEWLEKEAAELGDDSVSFQFPLPDRAGLAPLRVNGSAARELAQAVASWRQAAAARLTQRLETMLRRAEDEVDVSLVDQVAAEAESLPASVRSAMTARIADVRARRAWLVQKLSQCKNGELGNIDTEITRKKAADDLENALSYETYKCDLNCITDAIEKSKEYNNTFIETVARESLDECDIYQLKVYIDRLDARQPDAAAFEAVLQRWAKKLSEAVRSAAGPEDLEALAADLLRCESRVPEAVVPWVADRRQELRRYSGLWRNETVDDGVFPLKPLLPQPPYLDDRYQRLQDEREEAKLALAELENGSAERLSSLIRRLAEIHREWAGDSEISETVAEAGRLLVWRALNGSLATVEIDSLLVALREAGDIASGFRHLFNNWGVVERLAAIAAEADDDVAGDPETMISRWRDAVVAAEGYQARPQSVDVLIARLRDGALGSLEGMSAAAVDRQEALLKSLLDAAGLERVAAPDDRRVKALETLIRRRAVSAALDAGDRFTLENAVSALEQAAPDAPELALGRLRIGYFRALLRGPSALVRFLSECWPAISEAPPDNLPEAVLEAALAVVEDGGSDEESALALVRKAAALPSAHGRTAADLRRLDDWRRFKEALARGAADAPTLLVGILQQSVPDELNEALFALLQSPAACANPIVAALLHQHRLRSGRLKAGEGDPLLHLEKRGRLLAGNINAELNGAGALSREWLEEKKRLVDAEIFVWREISQHFRNLPFPTPQPEPPSDLDEARRRVDGGLGILADIEYVSDQDVRDLSTLRRCEFIREQVLTDTPHGALRDLLLDRANRLLRVISAPTRWSEWQAAVNEAARPGKPMAFLAAATALARLAAMLADAGLSGRAAESKVFSDAAQAVAALGPDLESETKAGSLGHLIRILRSLEEDEARVLAVLTAIRARSPVIPVGGHLNCDSKKNQEFLNLFHFDAPRSYRCILMVEFFVSDQRFDFIRKIDQSRFPAWLSNIIRGLQNA